MPLRYLNFSSAIYLDFTHYYVEQIKENFLRENLAFANITALNCRKVILRSVKLMLEDHLKWKFWKNFKTTFSKIFQDRIFLISVILDLQMHILYVSLMVTKKAWCYSGTLCSFICNEAYFRERQLPVLLNLDGKMVSVDL